MHSIFGNVTRSVMRRIMRDVMCNITRSIMGNITRNFTQSISSKHRAKEKLTGQFVKLDAKLAHQNLQQL